MLAGCIPNDPLDTTRVVPKRGTLGEEIFKLFDKDLKNDSPSRATGFELEKAGFVAGIDHVFPEPELSRDQQFLLNLLPLYDDGSLPDLTRTLGALVKRLEADGEGLAALAAVENRIGYVDLSHEEALIRRITKYPRFRLLNNALIDLALAHDGLDPTGAPLPSEDDSVTRLVGALASSMRDLQVSDDAQRNIVLAADLLLSEDTRLAPTASTAQTSSSAGPPAMIVARDPRGMALVPSINGAFPAPFVDMNRDGLADVDSSGRFVDGVGAAIDRAPFGTDGPRDNRARALDSSGGLPIYGYVNLNQTMAAGVLRDTRQLVADGIPMKLVRSFDKLLGARGPTGAYVAQNNVVLDLVYAASTTLDISTLPDLLELFGRLLNEHQGILAYLAEETDKQLDIADRYNVALKPGNTFFNDLMSTLRKVLDDPTVSAIDNKTLAQAVIDVVQTSTGVLGFPEASAQLMEHKKDLITQTDVANGTVLSEYVDRTTADVHSNQSLHQRVLHLIHDTRGARYEPNLVGIPLGFIFKIDDLAEFYMESVIGKAHIPPLVGTLTGLPEYPTPEALAVFINTSNMFGNPIGNEGIPVMNNDGDTLFAVPVSGMKDALAPLIQVFYTHQRMDLLFELFDDMHLHYATSASDYQDVDGTAPRYSHLSGLSAYEPLMIDVYRNTHVMAGFQQLLTEAAPIMTSGNHTPRDLLIAFGSKFLDKDETLTTRDGLREVDLPLAGLPGSTERITPLSPFDLIRGARNEIHTVVNRSATAQQEWADIVHELHDMYLGTQLVDPSARAARFTNPRLVPVATLLLDFLQRRAAAHSTAGTLDSWVRSDIPSTVSDFVTSKTLPAAFDLIYAIDADPDLSGMLDELRDQLLDENQGFGELLALVGDELGAAKDCSITLPLFHFLGNELDPNKKLVFTLLTHAKQSIAADPDEQMLEVARRAIEPAPDGGLYVSGLGRAIRQANRVHGADEGPLDVNDVTRIVHIVGTYMLDDQHGLEKFYQIVAGRK
jgi:hypothetical protein